MKFTRDSCSLVKRRGKMTKDGLIHGDFVGIGLLYSARRWLHETRCEICNQKIPEEWKFSQRVHRQKRKERRRGEGKRIYIIKVEGRNDDSELNSSANWEPLSRKLQMFPWILKTRENKYRMANVYLNSAEKFIEIASTEASQRYPGKFP